MSKGKPQQRKRARPGATQKTPKKSWWRKPGVWLGGAATTIVTGVVTGILVNVLGTQAQKVIAPAVSTPVTSASAQHQPSPASRQPTANLASPTRVGSASPRVQYAPYVAVRREAGFAYGCGSWIVAKPPNDVSPPPPNDAGWEAWVSQNNAIDATSWSPLNSKQLDGTSNLDITIQGRTSTPVVLTGIQFVILRRNNGVVHGGVVTNYCGGPMEARWMVVNLDRTPPNIVVSYPDSFPPPSGQPWQAVPVKFPYSVTDVDGEVFKIVAYTHSDCLWYAKLFWSVDGVNGESVINDNGRPFETALANNAAVAYGRMGSRWYICPKRAAFSCALHQ